MWPPGSLAPDEVELVCEGICLEEDHEVIWFAYGDLVYDGDEREFIPSDKDETRCPRCNSTESWSLA
jgi:hypothetical protein